MKLIILTLLISLNCLAEISVKVENTKGKKFGTQFPTLQKAQAWIDSNAPKGDFGKNERWVNSEKVADLSKCLEQREVFDDLKDPPVKLRDECKLPKEYSILICDDEQSYSEGHDCKPIVDDMLAKKQEKADRKAERNAIKKFDELLQQADTNAKWKLLIERSIRKLVKECM